jgi:hypothetical protein
MKKQQDAKFKRCDQLQAAISNFEMVSLEKGKMDDAVTAGTCLADFSNYIPISRSTIMVIRSLRS